MSNDEKPDLANDTTSRQNDESTLLPSDIARREGALRSLRALQLPFPPNYKFDRDEANER